MARSEEIKKNKINSAALLVYVQEEMSDLRSVAGKIQGINRICNSTNERDIKTNRVVKNLTYI
jgi:predicted ATP-grasp superfamily ATP-dependent carboligase